MIIESIFNFCLVSRLLYALDGLKLHLGLDSIVFFFFFFNSNSNFVDSEFVSNKINSLSIHKIYIKY